MPVFALLFRVLDTQRIVRQRDRAADLVDVIDNGWCVQSESVLTLDNAKHPVSHKVECAHLAADEVNVTSLEEVELALIR